jgi:site-specific DNA recombinase
MTSSPGNPTGKEGGAMKAAGYVRVSTQDQVEHGLNLDEDRQRIRETCEAEGWELVELFDDGAAQGDDPNRPELLALLDSLDRIDVVVLRSIERLSRDPMIHGLATNAFRAAGVRVHSFITGPVDIETPQGEFTSNLFAAMGKFEKRLTGQRVKQAMQARARDGLLPGGHAPYGYEWQDKRLAIVEAEAKIVRRIFTDYTSGMGQRGVVRALNADHVLTREGNPWRQSAITRILNRVAYTGKLSVRGADGDPQVVDGRHEPIIDDELWERAQTILAGASRRKGGRHADGGHLLVRGTLRCICGAAMLPRKARPGIERERYVCSARVEDPGSCNQPSLRRELIDQPFLAALLSGYIDLAATRQRIADRMDSALTAAQEAVCSREAEVAKIERALATTERDYDAGDITGKQFSTRHDRLSNELEGAKRALDQAGANVEQIEQSGPVGDAEQALLDHLASIRQATADGVEAAPDLHALRNTIGQMFEQVQLIRSPVLGQPVSFGQPVPEGMIPWHDDVPAVTDGEDRYWLLPVLRASAVDADTLKPIGHAMPVPVAQSYPPGFLARYCWW